MKAFILADGDKDWWNCTLLCEDGWAPFGHLCSHPNYAPGDLWLGRPKRQQAIQELGLTLDIHPEIFVLNEQNIAAEPLKSALKANDESRDSGVHKERSEKLDEILKNLSEN